jgi:hypothetical protein
MVEFILTDKWSRDAFVSWSDPFSGFIGSIQIREINVKNVND